MSTVSNNTTIAKPVANAQPAGNTQPANTLPPAPPERPGLNPDVLTVGSRTVDQVQALGKGITLEKAVKLTENNGVDEVFFQTDDGTLYVAHKRGDLDGIRPEYMGRYQGQRVTVMHVDDEKNTFIEGSKSIFEWCGRVLNKAFGDEASKALSTTVSTLAGGVIAASAFKGGAEAAKTAATAAPGALTAAKAAATGAFRSVISIGVPILTVVGGFLAIGALIGGVRSVTKKADFATLDMITDRY